MAHHEALCDCFGSRTSDRLSKYIPSLSHDKQLLETEASSRLPLLAPSNNIPIQVSHLQAVSSLTPLPSLNNSLNTWKIHQIKSLPAASSHGKSSTSSKQSGEGTGMKMRAGEAWSRLRKSRALTFAVRVQTLQVWSKKTPLNNEKPHTRSLAVKAPLPENKQLFGCEQPAVMTHFPQFSCTSPVPAVWAVTEPRGSRSGTAVTRQRADPVWQPLHIRPAAQEPHTHTELVF